MGEGKKTQAERKQERLAAALRENLKRRKARTRAASKALTANGSDSPDEISREIAKK